jgi:hypothetical protein
MREVNQLRDSAANAWRKHREELIPWGFGSLIYIVFMRQAGPSKFTVGMLAFLLAWPIVFAMRMAISMRRKTNKADENGENDGRS